MLLSHLPDCDCRPEPQMCSGSLAMLAAIRRASSLLSNSPTSGHLLGWVISLTFTFGSQFLSDEG